MRIVLACLLASLGMADASGAQSLARLTAGASSGAATLEELGAIVAAAGDSRGHLYVLDARGQVAALDRTLRIFGWFRARPGPNAFRDPARLQELGDGRLAVLDRGRRRITRMRLDEQTRQLVQLDTIALTGFSTEDMCALPGDRFLIYGVGEGMRLHVVDQRGRPVRAFAPADSSLSFAVQDQLATGIMGCDLARDVVVLTSAFGPRVEAFTISTGMPRWADSLQPFRPPVVNIRPSGGMSIRSGPAGKSLIQAVFGVGTCMIFQTTYVSRTDGVTEDTVVTYVKSPRGEHAVTATVLPRLLSVAGNTVLSFPTASDTLYRVQALSIDGCMETTPVQRSRSGGAP